LKILAIGNSFSEDATLYLHQIAQSDCKNIKVVNLYIGGCSLEEHFNNIKEDKKEYEYQLNGHKAEKKVSIKEALVSDTWDIVTMQQVSFLSVNYDTYQPYIKYLSDYIKKYAPKAEQVIHQTWAYEEGSERLTVELGYDDQRSMFEDLKASYALAAKDLGGLRIIPTGEAFQYALKNGITKLHRDTYHASLSFGRYIAAGTWYEMLTGNSMENNTFKNTEEPLDEELIPIAKKCIRLAIKEYTFDR